MLKFRHTCLTVVIMIFTQRQKTSLLWQISNLTHIVVKITKAKITIIQDNDASLQLHKNIHKTPTTHKHASLHGRISLTSVHLFRNVAPQTRCCGISYK